jgi:hypothetical protein
MTASRASIDYINDMQQAAGKAIAFLVTHLCGSNGCKSDFAEQ